MTVVTAPIVCELQKLIGIIITAAACHARRFNAIKDIQQIRVHVQIRIVQRILRHRPRNEYIPIAAGRPEPVTTPPPQLPTVVVY